MADRTTGEARWSGVYYSDGGTALPLQSTCAHGVGWASPCASCGRGYPSSAPPVISQWVDLSPVTAALARIEVLLERLLAIGGGTGG